MYGFDRRRTFRAGYMAGDSRSSREHGGHDEKSMVQGGSSSAKGKWDKNLRLVPLRQGGQTCESTHIMTIRLLIWT